MSFANCFNSLSTDELVERFKAATLQGQPIKEIADELAKRPGVAFIQATDSSEVTMEKARAAIHQLEQTALS